MPFCMNCGGPVNAGDRFCGRCGTPVQNTEAELNDFQKVEDVQPSFAEPDVQPAFAKPQVQPSFAEPDVQPAFAKPQMQPAVNPVAPACDFGDTVILSDPGDTVILSDSGDTVILSKSIDGGKLVNSRTGEIVTINALEFVIGREKSSVNYCVTGNATMGRRHAKIVMVNGSAYIVDLNSTNGTLVNGIKCAPMEQVALKNGDVITLSDEKFTYRAPSYTQVFGNVNVDDNVEKLKAYKELFDAGILTQAEFDAKKRQVLGI